MWNTSLSSHLFLDFLHISFFTFFTSISSHPISFFTFFTSVSSLSSHLFLHFLHISFFTFFTSLCSLSSHLFLYFLHFLHISFFTMYQLTVGKVYLLTTWNVCHVQLLYWSFHVDTSSLGCTSNMPFGWTLARDWCTVWCVMWPEHHMSHECMMFWSLLVTVDGQ
jgi:hypothetical protein